MQAARAGLIGFLWTFIGFRSSVMQQIHSLEIIRSKVQLHQSSLRWFKAIQFSTQGLCFLGNKRSPPVSLKDGWGWLMFGCFPSRWEPQLMVDGVNTSRGSFSKKKPLLRCASVFYCTEQCIVICVRGGGKSRHMLGFLGVHFVSIRETKRNAENDIVNHQH